MQCDIIIVVTKNIIMIQNCVIRKEDSDGKETNCKIRILTGNSDNCNISAIIY